LPFGGGITEVDMKGSMLIHVMQTGMKNINSGGFLQFQPVIFNPGNGTFVLNGSPIDSLRTYRVAVTDFLMTGKETNLSFLQRESAGIIKTHPLEGFQGNPKSDIRLAIIKYLESKQ
jgi:5'-nucleotidase